LILISDCVFDVISGSLPLHLFENREIRAIKSLELQEFILSPL
jgi:hypothetical protein